MRQRVGLSQEVHFIPKKENPLSLCVLGKKKKKITKEEAAKALFRKEEEKGQK